jgi:hypothetical protein
MNAAFGPTKGVEQDFFSLEVSQNAKFQVPAARPLVGNFKDDL